ncbi:hypothetical protein JCM8097_005841 [Rhodosporidiobolus ruineniae]
MFSLAVLTVLALGWLYEIAQPEVADGSARPALLVALPLDPASVALPDSPPPSPEPAEPDFTLPADIVLLILDHVASFELEEQANRTLAACCLVSRRMCRLAQPYLHRELHLELVTADPARDWLQCFDQASLARLRLAVAKPSLISRLSSISIKVDVICWVLTAESARVWNDFATHLQRNLALRMPRLPWPVRYWPEGSPHLFDLVSRHVVQLELVKLWDEDLIILAEFPSLRTLQALCLRTLTIDNTATANTDWSICTPALISQLDTLLSSSLPLAPSTLSTRPAPFSTFKTTLLVPGGDDNLSAVLQAFEFSGLPQRIKTDPRLARVEEVRFEVGEAAVQ